MNELLNNCISKLNGTVLQKGEIVLLAKAICDNIPLPSKDISEDIDMYMITNKLKIMEILDVISTRIYISNKEFIYSLVKRLMAWRISVAYSSTLVLFNLGNTAIAEDFTSLSRYLDVTELSSISDIYSNASYMYSIFNSIATCIFRGVNNEY